MIDLVSPSFLCLINIPQFYDGTFVYHEVRLIWLFGHKLNNTAWLK